MDDPMTTQDGYDWPTPHLAQPMAPYFREQLRQPYCGRCDRGPKQAPSCPHGVRCGRPGVGIEEPAHG